MRSRRSTRSSATSTATAPASSIGSANPDAGAGLVLLPELAVTGYPPGPCFCGQAFCARRPSRSRRNRGRDEGDRRTRRNAASRPRPLQRVRCLRRRRGQGDLPRAVLSELRRLRRGPLFSGGARAGPTLRCGETLIGPTICEDIWQPGPPATDLALAGAHIVANISGVAVPPRQGREREEMLATRARRTPAGSCS